MSFDFPNTPANGDRYTPAGGPTYVWSNGVWLQSTTPLATRTARPRNRVNNPTAQISQENGNTVMQTSGTYPADQWAASFVGISGAGQRIAALSTLSPEGTPTAMAIWATVAKASLAAGDYLSAMQYVEGLDMADFAWGTAAAKPAVLRFNALCDVAGTYGFNVINGTVGNRSYTGSFNIPAAGTWYTFAIPIPGDTTGTWNKDNTAAMTIRFTYACGSTYIGAAGWSAGNFLCPAGCTNGAAQITKVLFITDLGLYKDPDNTGLPPPWEPPSYEDDLDRCMRYWQILDFQISQNGTAGNQIQDQIFYPTPMRATPSFGTIAAGSATNVSTASYGGANNRRAMILITPAATGQVSYFNNVQSANARM